MARTPYLFLPGSRLGVDNLILSARSAHHRVDNFAGPLSIKTVVSGEVSWIIGGREFVVDPTSFLVLSADTTYSMNIAADKPVETCCAFFAPGFVEELASGLTSPVATALDGGSFPLSSLPYLSVLHQDPERAAITRMQTAAKRCRQALAPIGFEEEFLELALQVLHLYERITNQVARLPAVRQSTRDELFRRLLIGREYLHSQSSKSVSLVDVARSAGLSLFHFHRGFTQAFEQTPHAYLSALRLERARLQIEAGATVLDACLAVGFSSPSAFTRLFRSHYGAPPSAFRRKLARSGKTGP